MCITADFSYKKCKVSCAAWGKASFMCTESANQERQLYEFFKTLFVKGTFTLRLIDLYAAHTCTLTIFKASWSKQTFMEISQAEKCCRQWYLNPRLSNSDLRELGETFLAVFASLWLSTLPLFFSTTVVWVTISHILQPPSHVRAQLRVKSVTLF